MVDPRADHESVGRQPRAVLEEPGEVVGAHADHSPEPREREVLIQVRLDVLGHPPQPGARQQGLAICARSRCCRHRQLPSGVVESREATARAKVSRPWNRTFSPVLTRSTTPLSWPASSCRMRTMKIVYSPKCSVGSMPRSLRTAHAWLSRVCCTRAAMPGSCPAA